MKTRWLFLILFILTFPAFAESPKDVDGWNKVRWGMTEAEVSAAFPGQVVPFDKADSVACKSQINDLKIVSTTFKVIFDFDCATKKLQSVALRPNPAISRDAAIYTFEKLTEELKLKYGDPISVDSNHGLATATWLFPSTQIVLSLLALDSGNTLLLLTYDKREQENML